MQYKADSSPSLYCISLQRSHIGLFQYIVYTVLIVFPISIILFTSLDVQLLWRIPRHWSHTILFQYYAHTMSILFSYYFNSQVSSFSAAYPGNDERYVKYVTDIRYSIKVHYSVFSPYYLPWQDHVFAYLSPYHTRGAQCQGYNNNLSASSIISWCISKSVGKTLKKEFFVHCVLRSILCNFLA